MISEVSHLLTNQKNLDEKTKKQKKHSNWFKIHAQFGRIA